MIGEILAVVLSSPDFLLLALILGIGALVQCVRALCRLMEWFNVTLRSSEGRLRTLATTAFCVALGAETTDAAAGHIVALSLTMYGWMLWRRSVTI